MAFNIFKEGGNIIVQYCFIYVATVPQNLLADASKGCVCKKFLS